jgi:hypothetical protein
VIATVFAFLLTIRCGLISLSLMHYALAGREARWPGVVETREDWRGVTSYATTRFIRRVTVESPIGEARFEESREPPDDEASAIHFLGSRVALGPRVVCFAADMTATAAFATRFAVGGKRS